MPSQSTGAQPFPVESFSYDALPPHRAAIPVPPVSVDDAPVRGGRFPWVGVSLAALLHCALFAAAVIWGQGGTLPPMGPGIEVELVDRIGSTASQLPVAESAPRAEPASDTRQAALPGPPPVVEASPSGDEAPPAAIPAAPAPGPSLTQIAGDVSPPEAENLAASSTGDSNPSLAENLSEPAGASPLLLAEAPLIHVPAPVHAEAIAGLTSGTGRASPAVPAARREPASVETPADPAQRSTFATLSTATDQVQAASEAQAQTQPEAPTPALQPDIADVPASAQPAPKDVPALPQRGPSWASAASNPPPLPARAKRLERIILGAGALSTAVTAAIGPTSSAARSSAKRMVAALYQRRVRMQIQRHAPLGDLGSGYVAVGMRLSRSGRLLGAFVQHSSGNPAVDRAALLCVRAAQPFPPIPPGIGTAQLALSIPFRFE